jgi:uncharacterized membrane protein YfcA
MTIAMLAGLTAAVLVGAVTQRSTGMGFALVAAPFLVLLLGPFQGILVANVCGTVAALLNLTQVYRLVDWRRARWVIPAGVIGVVPGAVAVRTMPSAILAIVVSAVVLAGLAFTVFGQRLTFPNSPAVAGVGGLASGFMNVTAGVGGPGLVIYGLATNWEHSRFAATAQLHFAVLGGASLAFKAALPSVSWQGWVAMTAALVVGLAIGNVLAPRINGKQAMRLVVAIAAAGALIALIQAIRQL